jgi:hypothetical protein
MPVGHLANFCGLKVFVLLEGLGISEILARGSTAGPSVPRLAVTGALVLFN